MCKLLAIVDIENEDAALEFADAMVKPMTKNDDDGLGLITMTERGLTVERWLVPTDYPRPEYIPSKLEKYASLIPSRYNTLGPEVNTPVIAIGVHARMATGAKTLANVHPFVQDGLALIHNGVITNHERFKKELSTCDSEALLALYREYKVSDKLESIQKVSDDALGWYAFMVFNEETQTVDIIRDRRASLYFASVETVGTVFSTSDDFIRQTCGRLKLKQPEIYQFPSDTAIRWTYGKQDIETYDIQSAVVSYTGWPEKDEKTETPIVDVSKDTAKDEDKKWCAHGRMRDGWCGFCEMEERTNKDVPISLREKS